MLNPFQIRDLHVPVEENLYDAESVTSGPDNGAPNRGASRHGTVQLSAPEYDQIVSYHPRARLTYMDDDDGEIVTVSLSVLFCLTSGLVLICAYSRSDPPSSLLNA
jgi:hypothetical protein